MLKRKPIGSRNGLKIYTRLKATKPINKVSGKTKKLNTQLSQQRKLLLDNSDGKCELCGKLPDFRGLQVHHKLFRSKGGKHNLENLSLICGTCHNLLHGVHEA